MRTEPGFLRINRDPDDAVVQVAVRGRWDWQLLLAVRTAVHKCLAEHPAGLIIDLRELDDMNASSAPLWFAVRRVGESLRPPVRVVLCLWPQTPLGKRLVRLGAKRFLPIYLTVEQARAALADEPQQPQRR